ncbi:MAG: hypothetical protein OEM25_02325, partial [Gammaproteobacteria bacterium]|nr:hypothetical protein [Gammaproteobacteria bacterium]
MGKITTLLVFALTLTRAFAQQAALTDTLVEDEIRRYKVEVIVFTYEEDVSIGSEVFLPDEPPAIEEPLLDEDGYPRDLEALPFADDARRVDQPFEEAPAWTVDLGVDDGERRQIADVRAARDLRIELLGDDELELVREIRQLELLDAYRTIMHVGW